MIKWVALLKRPSNMTVDELHEWWLGQHATLAKGLPGLRKYVISLVAGAQRERPQYDGMAELWFDSMDDARRAQASPVGKDLEKDVNEYNITVEEMYTEEHVML